jgi:serine/threonine protein kinase/tetratricopeptide (TPR) repeat protein
MSAESANKENEPASPGNVSKQSTAISHEPTVLFRDPALEAAAQEGGAGAPQRGVTDVAHGAPTAGSALPRKPVAAPEKLGRYEIKQLLGRGGMGEVYIGHDPQLQRRVAVKVPRFGKPADAERFALEARQLAQLHHPGIVTIFDVGNDAGLSYMVSDFVAGTSLHEWLKLQRPTWQETARIIATVADALAYAHAQRVVHRDVKAENIIMKDNRTPVLVDFGLAISDDALSPHELGVVSGTPNYMAPEQAAGKAHRIDGRTDIYALGVVLYRMLCGRIPFSSPDVYELLRQVREDDPQPPRQLVPELPLEMERICLKAMSKRPSDRYTTAGDMALELRACLSQAASAAPASSSQQVVAAADSSKQSAVSSSGRRARQAERRLVTVLYCRCDLFDSAELLEKLDPEEQHDLLTDYQQLCIQAVKLFGGTIVQSTGRDLIVCLGYPIAYEDAAQRALRTALAMRDRVLELAERIQRQFGATLSIWIGIHTGPVVAEEAANPGDALSLAGEARNVASHMHVAAQPNTILISQATHRLTRAFFIYESIGSHAIRGAAQALELFKVVSEGEVKSRIEVAELAGLTPLVGRELELQILKDRWEKATESMGQVVLLIGDAGLGKSRLLRELRESISLGGTSASSIQSNMALAQVPQVIEWRCSPYYDNTALYPATEFFTRWLGIRREDEPQQQLDKLVKHLESLDLAEPQTVALFASLLSIPYSQHHAALEVTPQRLKELTQEALIDWLRACTARHPVLFLVEDLHWVDPSTLEFLGSLIDQAAGDQLLAVLTFRPEFQAPWKSKAHQTELALSRLTKRQVGEVMEKKTGLKNLPADLVARIVERTDGVPLFIEEFTQVLLESDALRNVAGRMELADSSTLDAIPATLQDLLLARLNRMDSMPEVSQMGAALGREFGYDLLHATLDLDEKALQEELAKLVAAEILMQKGRLPRCVYTFKHALIQDAAYQSLLKKTRQQFHTKIGSTLEQQFPETAKATPELLAHHFSEAGAYEKGVTYWHQAGLHSQARSANQEAISHFTTGLKLLQELAPSPERDRLELALQAPLGVVLTAARGWGAPEVAPTIERARALCEQYGSVDDRFFVVWGLWGFRLLRLELPKCWELAADVMRLLEGVPERKDLLAEAEWIPGCTAFYAGDFPSALEHFGSGMALFNEDQARAHALRTGQNVGVMFRCHIALVLWEMGLPDQALKCADEMMQFARKLGHPFSYAMALYYRRRVGQCCGSEELVRKSIEEECALCQQQGFAFWGAHAFLARGSLLISQGKIEEARSQTEATWQMLQAAGLRCSLSHPCSFLTESFLNAGRLDEAALWLRRGLDLVEQHGERCLDSELLRLQGELLLAQSPQGEAEAATCFEKAADVARRQHARSRELRALMSLCRLTRNAEAARLLSEVYSSFTEGRDSAVLKQAKGLLERLPIGG